jgi:hypothetical protein
MFEQTALNNLVYNDEFVRKTIAYIKPEYFMDHSERFVFEMIYDYYMKYNARPTKEALAIIAHDSGMEENKFTGVVEVISKIEQDNNDTKWLTDKAEEWAQEKAVYNAVMKSIGIIQGDDKTLDKHAIPSLLTEALAVSFDSYLGLNYFEQSEAQFEYLHSETTKFPFSIDILNRVTKGGVPKKTLNIFLMSINGGKSTWLVDQSSHWLLNGKNVVFFALEQAEEVVRERIDVRTMDLTFDEVFGLDQGQYMGRIDSIRKRTMGELYVKGFPNGVAHVGHMRHYLEELRIKKGFVPDLIVIDYMTIMASSKLPASAKGNTNTYFTSVAEETRGLAFEYDCPVWTAAQFTRSGQSGSQVGMSEVAQAIGIAATADFMLNGAQPEEMIPLNQILMSVMKNRYNGKNKFSSFIMGLDNDKQKFYDVNIQTQLHVTTNPNLRESILGKTEAVVDESVVASIDADTGEVIFNPSKNFKPIEGWV